MVVKDGQRLTRYTLGQHPFDVVGWDGMVYPYTFNADDFEPITGKSISRRRCIRRSTLPASSSAPSAGGCSTRTPMRSRSRSSFQRAGRRGALYVPADSAAGAASRGTSSTLPPARYPHGPHPGTIMASKDVKSTDELAVMLDTFKPLLLTKQALELDDAGYPFSWVDG